MKKNASTYLKSKAHHRCHTKFKLATWNIQGGIFDTIKCHQVMQEVKRLLDISICTILETKAQDIGYKEHPYGNASTSKHYENAFAVKKNV
jgi:hypothetical protein